MTGNADQPDVEPGRQKNPRVDTQSLSDLGTHIYETVATLEFAGQAVSQDAIAAATRLPPDELEPVLLSLVSQGLLTSTGTGDDRRYQPAQRHWSTQPGHGTGHLHS